MGKVRRNKEAMKYVVCIRYAYSMVRYGDFLHRGIRRGWMV